MSGGRDVVLGRIRRALADVPAAERPEDVAVPRDYRTTHTDDDPARALDLLAARLADYRARVHRCGEQEIPRRVAELLAERGSRAVVVPGGLPSAWLSRAEGVEVVTDDPGLTHARLDGVRSVVTGCALAIAETGTLVLDASPDQGSRRISLIPDHHVCVVRAPAQVVASVPLALPRLDPARPLTWISGPSATSDIELDRVEGVHGPRVLDVIIATTDG
ncbi:LUD domain-containing protein [Streptomyces sp. PTM05]|uniref:LUD domain-containing protein n=1 Tax=Streptantibioticus parmotrematis TaxID=2873249 RepID=A0ABS7QUX2_9ACTN|nr:LUD domain-containing protein [Streptantibioticus parmotrematis]MBY8885584.1 LUD domain-containing protein [Streptantibioticus parmotrematis]